MSEKERTALSDAVSIQEENLQAISDAIKEKRGINRTIDAKDFPDEIRKIETGITLPTLTNPGVASDLKVGKQFIDQSGGVVTGSIPEIGANGSMDLGSTAPTQSTASIILQKSINSDEIVRSGATIKVSSPLSNFGNAEAADVVSGKTFTSNSGVTISGSMPNVGDLVKEVFSFIGSSNSVSNQIKMLFNQASLGFHVDDGNDEYQPFLNVVSWPYWSGAFNGENNLTISSYKDSGLVIPIPTVHDYSDDITILSKLNSRWTGMAFIYLYDSYLLYHELSPSDHIIGGYVLRAGESGWLTIKANSTTVVQNQWSSTNYLRWQTKSSPIQIYQGVRQSVIGNGYYYHIYYNPTSAGLDFLYGDYLIAFW